MKPIKKIENLLSKYLPIVYADGVSSLLHGLLVSVPTFVVGHFLFGPLGTVAGGYLLYLYWKREDGDRAKAQRIADHHYRLASLRDSRRDRIFPIVMYVIANAILYL